MKRAGVSYFGVRILRHVRRDLQDVAARGYAAVLHTFSENDLAYYRGTMADIVAASHEAGLEVQMCPWGVGRTFGGEAESRWVTMHPEACQVLDDGRPVATGCLNQPAYRAFCKDWADAALACGTDYVFWDEPHWTVPEHAGIDDIWTWGYEACGHMTHLATSDAPLVWEAVTRALTRRPALELRPTRALVRSINVADATVADAVAGANGQIAAAIDAIVARLEAGGRLVYVGAGTSGRIAASDADECGPTFSTDLISAVHTEVEAEEDDAELARLDVGERDVVLGVRASGRTPYTLGALSRARAAGA